VTGAHAHAVDADGVLAIAKTGERNRWRQQHQSHRYHAQTMTQGFYRACQSRLFGYAAAVLGGPLGAWLLVQAGWGLRNAACAPNALLTLLVLAPIIEETVFRFGLHNWFAAKFHGRVACLSLANVLVALVFGGLHALHQGSAMMLLTAVPALVFGWMWELSGRQLIVPVLVHAWYNLCITLASCQ
jgi:membrane protease YdiL (CAAX protease family)